MLDRVLLQDPQRDSGSAGAKKVLDALKNDAKANFQETSLAKVNFRKNGFYDLLI